VGSRAVEPRRAVRRQQLQDVAILLPSGGHDAEHSFDETAARLTVGSAAALTPQHRMTQHMVGVVVGRLDPFDPDEGPQEQFLFEQFAASSRRINRSKSGTSEQLQIDRFLRWRQSPPSATRVRES